jgi:molecular chaperone GrpE (heat shock protein)
MVLMTVNSIRCPAWRRLMLVSPMPYAAAMQDAPQLPELKVPKWPFFLADAFMLGLAYYLFYYQTRPNVPLSQWEVIACCVCVFLAALLGIMPYLLEYRAVIKYGALLKLIETSSLTAATEKIQNLESCVAQIGAATDHLQTAQAQADKTANLANEITERMAQEVKEFSEFLAKANDGEKATLRLEVEKLRRGEHEWVQVLVFILDHVYALNKAAERSGQENLIKQLGHFQNTCRDAARRVGLAPVLAAAGEAFDPQKHQLPEGEAPAGGLIGDVVATGYSYQSKLIRPVVVKIQVAAATGEQGSLAETTAQSQLPLGAAELPTA